MCSIYINTKGNDKTDFAYNGNRCIAGYSELIFDVLYSP